MWTLIIIAVVAFLVITVSMNLRALSVVRRNSVLLSARTGIPAECIYGDIVDNKLTPGEWAMNHDLDPHTFGPPVSACWAMAVALALVLSACSSATDAPVVGSTSTQPTTPSKAPEQTLSEQKTTSSAPTQLVYVRYRSDPVDVALYDRVVGRGSLVRNAWYDGANQYLLIDLAGTTYHYCGVPREIWIDLGNAQSLGTFYNQRLKGEYGCQSGPVPQYDP